MADWIRAGLIWWAVLGSAVAAPQADRYWEWGWGIYGASEELDVARFDWSLINFGNVPADERTVERCNEILRLNPTHKFLIRVWPIIGLGDCPENRQQATFLHFRYVPEVREKVLAAARRQVRLVVDGVTRPENVVGCIFLEELPGHFSSAPFRRWRSGDPLPWDLKRFEKELAAELGEPYDFGKEAHRLWWGKAYTEAINTINRALKEESGGRTVIYYQATGWNTLDHLAEGEDLFKTGTVPIRYADILIEGVCDGIFGYPNNELVWQRQTVAMVEKLGCVMFSQVSTPPGMRLSTLEQMTELARWRHPGNLGFFLYLSAGRGQKAWNELPYLDGSRYWTIGELARRFAWEHQIGIDTIERHLGPRIALDYQGAGKRQDDFIHVYGQVENPRDASWYGGDEARAWMRQVTVTLEVPAGFDIPLAHSPPPTLNLGDIPPRGARAGDWWVRVTGDGSLPAGGVFRLRAAVEGAPPAVVESGSLQASIPSLQPREIAASGDQWVEPGYQLPAFEPAVELDPSADETVFPGLASGNQSVLYRDVLRGDTRLVIGPGYRARLFAKPLVEPEAASLKRWAGEDGVAVFSDGYGVAASPRLRVRPGSSYRFTATGSVADGAIFHAIVFFEGTLDGKPVKVDKSCFYNQLKAEERTVETLVETPAADPGTLTAIIRFYRHKQLGTLRLRSFDFRYADIPPEGLDVTQRLEGTLPDLARPFTIWTYSDRSDPNRYGRYKLRLQFYQPSHAQPDAGKPERQGADDF